VILGAAGLYETEIGTLPLGGTFSAFPAIVNEGLSTAIENVVGLLKTFLNWIAAAAAAC
jgi:hypothetical protein